MNSREYHKDADSRGKGDQGAAGYIGSKVKGGNAAESAVSRSPAVAELPWELKSREGGGKEFSGAGGVAE